MAKEKKVKTTSIDTEVNSKIESLNRTLSEIRKQYGNGAIMRMDESSTEDVEVIPTGSIGLDKALGVGGIPRGRIIEVYGPEAGGKTTLALQILAEAQRLGGTVAFIDAEHALDLAYAQKLGIDPAKLFLTQPDSGEQGLEITESLVRSGAIDIIVIDSVAALVPAAELSGEMGDAQMGLQARLMSQALRKLTAITSKTNTTVLFINQLRCLPKNTLVIDSGRIKYISELLPGNCVIRDISKTNSVLSIYDSGMVEGKTVEVKYRGFFTLSDTHTQPIIRNGSIQEVTGDKLLTGDFLVQPILGQDTISDSIDYIDLTEFNPNLILPSWANNLILPKLLDEDMAFFMGCYYSDGYMLYPDKDISLKHHYSVAFTEKNKERHVLITNIAKKLFPELNVCISNELISLNSKQIVEFCKNIGLKRYGKNKTIPELILKSRRSVIKAFLRGVFFDTHGFDRHGFIFTNENPNSIEDIATLLYYFGIFVDARKDGVDWYNRLYITGEDAINFSNIIGFAEQTKQNKCRLFEFMDNARGKYDVVPLSYGQAIYQKIKEHNIKGLCKRPYFQALKMCLWKNLNCGRRGLIKLLTDIQNSKFESDLHFLTNNRFTEIVKIQDTSFEGVDIETDNDQLFIADKFLTHNSKIGVVFGPTETTTGGNALKFYASVRLDVRRVASIKEDDVPVGNRVKVKVVKNKVSPPFRECEFDLLFGKGIFKMGELVDLSENYGIIEKSGAWYKYNGENIGHGRDKTIEYLEANDTIRKEIEKALKEIS